MSVAHRRIALLVFTFLVSTYASALAQRLPDTVIPVHYMLWFAPDFTTDTFRGRESIEVRLRAPSSAITLHATEITFGAVTITAGGRTQTASVSLDAVAETATLTVPQTVP